MGHRKRLDLTRVGLLTITPPMLYNCPCKGRHMNGRIQIYLCSCVSMVGIHLCRDGPTYAGERDGRTYLCVCACM